MFDNAATMRRCSHVHSRRLLFVVESSDIDNCLRGSPRLPLPAFPRCHVANALPPIFFFFFSLTIRCALRDVDMSFNNLGDKVTNTIMRGCSHLRLRSLALAGVDLKPKGVAAVVKTIAEVCTQGGLWFLCVRVCACVRVIALVLFLPLTLSFLSSS